jgi:NAD+ diphosphatase
VPPRPDLGQQPRLGYIASAIDRMAMCRSDEAALKKFAVHPQAGVYIVAGELVLLKTNGDKFNPLFSRTEAHDLIAGHETIFLGTSDGAPRYGFAGEPQAAEALKARSDLKITDLRSIAVQGLVSEDHLPPLAEAKALLGWHARHRFCPNCGSPTDVVQAGWRRDCPSCKIQHFPRIDPVVIMLVIAGECAVLGRSRRFVPTMWSCLAGFAEPGETIEEAVRREVIEEVGIACGHVRYFASQPWPFPSSIMIGCHAEALSETIVVDREELEDARWFDREELASMLKRQHPQGLTTPPPIAIAHHIIRDFVEDGADVLD